MCALNEVSIFAWLISVGTIGAFAKFIVANSDFSRSPYEIEKPRPKSWDVVAAHMFSRLLLGAIAGGLVGLIMVDSVKPEYGAALRLMFFAFAAGYSAPELMKSQERKLIHIIDKHLSKAVDPSIIGHSSQGAGSK